ncbi:MAG: hypothetical protein H6622_09250 [Halobacteriovoraceae bacterium]|nr:hypothetical protein [Halobacteriovoraceae bacterium]
MRKWSLLLLLLILNGCATHSNKEYENYSHLEELPLPLREIGFSDNDFKVQLNHIRTKYKEYINEAIYKKILEVFNQKDFNKYLMDKALTTNGYEKFADDISKMMSSSIIKKVNKLRVKEIDEKEIKDYLDSYADQKDHKERAEYIRKLLLTSNPSQVGLKGLIDLTLRMTSDSKQKDYSANKISHEIYSHFMNTYYFIGLYAYKDLSVEDLKEWSDLQDQQYYQNTRVFLELIQQQTIEHFMRMI